MIFHIETTTKHNIEELALLLDSQFMVADVLLFDSYFDVYAWTHSCSDAIPVLSHRHHLCVSQAFIAARGLLSKGYRRCLFGELILAAFGLMFTDSDIAELSLSNFV